ERTRRHGDPTPKPRAGDGKEEARQIPCGEGEAGEGEEREAARPLPPQEHGDRQRQGDDRCQQRTLGAQIQGSFISGGFGREATAGWRRTLAVEAGVVGNTASGLVVLLAALTPALAAAEPRLELGSEGLARGARAFHEGRLGEARKLLEAH